MMFYVDWLGRFAASFVITFLVLCMIPVLVVAGVSFAMWDASFFSSFPYLAIARVNILLACLFAFVSSTIQ